MKNHFIVCLLFVMCLSYSQSLEYQKGRFYLDGTKIKDREAKALYSDFAPSLELYKKSKEKGVIGGFLLGAGIGLVITDMAMGGYKYNYEYPQSITFVGLGCIAISIPVLHGRRKKMIESARLYNEHQSQLKNATGSVFELNFVNNMDGLGIQLQF